MSNKAILVGNLGSDPEIRYTQAGQPVCNFSLATNEQWKDKSGDRQERTEWHRIVVWGNQAVACGTYLKKGRSVMVEGRLRTREWTDKNEIKRYTTEIHAYFVEFLGGARNQVSAETKSEANTEVEPELDAGAQEIFDEVKTS